MQKSHSLFCRVKPNALLLAIFVLGIGGAYSQTITPIQNTGISPLNGSTSAFFDYNNDGKLDYFSAGQDSFGSLVAKMYQNNSLNGSMVGTSITIPGMSNPANSIGDFNNDGKLDIAALFADVNGNPQTAVYANSLTSFPLRANLYPSISVGDIQWGDYDNDGDLDLATIGFDSSFTRKTVILKKDAGTFHDIGASILGYNSGTLDWVDYDADGDLDLFVSGEGVGFIQYSKMFINTPLGFVEDVAFGSTVIGMASHTSCWGDFDADGYMDLLLGGTSALDSSHIYKSAGGVFSEFARLPHLSGGEYAWADLDGNGTLDIFATGSDGSNFVSRIYKFDGTSFVDQGSLPIEGISGNGEGKVVDFNNDGMLDYFVMGSANSGPNIAYFYQTGGVTVNTPPATPTGVSYTFNSDSSITFQWQAPIDDHTPSIGLSYSLNIGNVPDGSEVVSAPADLNTGYRRVVEYGQVVTTSWTLKNVSCANDYYFQVQAVDGGYMGSRFSAPMHVIISPTASVAQSGNTLNAQIGGPAPSLYQWTDAAGVPIPGATNSSYTLTDTFVIGLIVTSGPCTDTVPPAVRIYIGTENPHNVSNVKVWPNPSSTNIHVRVDNPGATQSIAIYDMQGRLMRIVESGFAAETSIPVEDFSTGLYLLKLTLQDGRGIATATFRKD